MGREAARPVVLVTAGPTREHIDAVRFLSNASSGRMGFAVAAEAARRGLRVILVSGPVDREDPPGVEVHRVVSAREMARKVLDFHPVAGIVVAAAAVCDFRPKDRLDRKLDKREGLEVEWVRNPDILADIAPRKGQRVHVGFALETGDLEAAAEAKLRRKGLDLIVANGPENLGAAGGSFLMLEAMGMRRLLVETSKEEAARAILDWAEAIWAARAPSRSGAR